MTKVFRDKQHAPRSVADYERTALDAPGSGRGASPEAILEEARQEAERKVKEAYAEGYRRGADAGKREYLEAVAASAEALNAAARAMQEAHDAFLESLEPRVVDLALAVASRILHREAKTDPDLVQTTVRRALQHLLDLEEVTIRVNPEDFEALREEKVKLLDEFDGAQHLVVQADPAIARGGCVAESALMYVDARLEAQLKEIVNALRGAAEPPGLD